MLQTVTVSDDTIRYSPSIVEDFFQDIHSSSAKAGTRPKTVKHAERQFTRTVPGGKRYERPLLAEITLKRQ